VCDSPVAGWPAPRRDRAWWQCAGADRAFGLSAASSSITGALGPDAARIEHPGLTDWSCRIGPLRVAFAEQANGEVDHRGGRLPGGSPSPADRGSLRALRRSADTRCRVTPKLLAICSIVRPSA
jgi:hypothetical protein